MEEAAGWEKNYVDVRAAAGALGGDHGQPDTEVCLGLKETHEEQVILVTKDILLRIKAQILGISAEDFTTEQVFDNENQYKGRIEVYVPEEFFKDFKKKGIPVQSVYVTDGEGGRIVLNLQKTSLSY